MEIPATYRPIIQIIRDSLVESGGSLMYSPDDYGCNSHYPSKDGKVHLTMDYGTVHRLITPHGTITPLGSHGCGDGAMLIKLLTERLGLEVHEPQRDDRKFKSSNDLEYQLCESGPDFIVTLPLLPIEQTTDDLTHLEAKAA